MLSSPRPLLDDTRLGTGRGVAVLFNAHARLVTPQTVRRLARALPDALVLVSEDEAQARRQVDRILASRPEVVLSGGGDGSAVMLLNLMRHAGRTPFPPIGLLPLGTGNGWARSVGASPLLGLISRLPGLPRPLPTRRFDLVEVEGTLCHFTGAGLDARLLNDYVTNLDRESMRLFGAGLARRLNRGVAGYIWTGLRTTIPGSIAEAWRQGPLSARIEGAGDGEERRVLFEGPATVCAVATVSQYGFGFKAFPLATAVPGRVDVRVYDRSALTGLLHVVGLWRGTVPLPGVHDYFPASARIVFSRDVPFHIGGDAAGYRRQIDVRVAQEAVDIVDWTAACAA